MRVNGVNRILLYAVSSICLMLSGMAIDGVGTVPLVLLFVLFCFLQFMTARHQKEWLE
jgi:hypothetical protein